MEYYGANDWRNYLAHYGVKGMKWDKHLKAKSELNTVGLKTTGLKKGPIPTTKSGSKIGIIKGVAGGAARTPGVLNTSDDGFIYVSDKSKRVGDGPYMNAAEKAAAIKAQNKEIKAAKKAAAKEKKKREKKKAADKVKERQQVKKRVQRVLERTRKRSTTRTRSGGGSSSSLPTSTSAARKGIPAKIRRTLDL